MTTWIRTLASAIALFSVSAIQPAFAQLDAGTWIRQSANGPAMTMTIEACCSGGRRITYHIATNNTEIVLTVETRLDGADAPVMMAGKPSGETMAITREDDHHASTVVKMNGAAFGTSKSTLSADGKTLTVVNDFSASVGGQQAGKTTETWVRK